MSNAQFSSQESDSNSLTARKRTRWTAASFSAWALVTSYSVWLCHPIVSISYGGVLVVIFTFGTYAGFVIGGRSVRIAQVMAALSGTPVLLHVPADSGSLAGIGLAAAGVGVTLGMSASLRMKEAGRREIRQRPALLLLGGDLLIVAGLILWMLSPVASAILVSAGVGGVVAAHVLRMKRRREVSSE